MATTEISPAPLVRPVAPVTLLALSLLFLVSGFAALIYQIVWQRVLFTAFGVNIESITIIVAVFMFGLGVGAVVGGYLSQRFPGHLPHLFLVCELIIGVFGLCSLPLIRAVSALTLHGSLFTIAVAVYVLLCIPTIFMGATLPILSTYLHRANQNVGRSVSTLYFFNTLGSAIACFVTAEILFGMLGLQRTIYVAAACNLVVGFFVFLYVRVLAGADASVPDSGEIATINDERADQNARRFWLVLLLAGAVGYLSLSQEIIWLRAVAHVTRDHPADFAHVLGSLLIGIALGAGFSRWFCRRNPDSALGFIAVMLILSTISFGLSLPLYAETITKSEVLGVGMGFFLVAWCAFLLGAILPTLCHYAVRGGSVGVPISWIYFSNILGATAGPLVTGFVLLDLFTLEQNALILTVLAAALAICVVLAATLQIITKLVLLGTVAASLLGLTLNYSQLYAQLLEKLHATTEFDDAWRYKHLIQTRSGIVAVKPSGRFDAIFGGSVYDGMFNVDPLVHPREGSNYVERAYIFPTLHPNPEEVLVVGMSSGSWLRALTYHKDIKKITVVEINPGYEEVIKNYPEIEKGLKDPRVTLYIDDGRRWLNRHPNAKFDLMIMNTIMHWRSNATNLLSQEFLEICKSHLKPGGILFYNPTGSMDVVHTAANCFKHVTLISHSMIAASESPFTRTYEERKASLLRFEKEGRRIFGPESNNVHAAPVLEELATVDVTDFARNYREDKELWHITDDNMATEFRRRPEKD